MSENGIDQPKEVWIKGCAEINGVAQNITACYGKRPLVVEQRIKARVVEEGIVFDLKKVNYPDGACDNGNDSDDEFVALGVR